MGPVLDTDRTTSDTVRITPSDPHVPAQPPLNIATLLDPNLTAVPPGKQLPHTGRVRGTRSVQSEHLSQDLKSDGVKDREEDLIDQEDEDMHDFMPRTLREFNVPRAEDVKGAIRLPRIVGYQLNFNPGVINIVQQNTFYGLDHEDPHSHLQTFLECCTTIRTNGVTNDYIILALFPFTLRDKAKKWLGSLPRDSITSWRVLSNLFLTRFFPHKRTAKVRTQLTSFRQKFDELLNEAWERFRKLQYSCPHHGILDLLLIQTFYDGLTESTRTSVDAVAGGTLMDMDAHDAMNLIDNMAQNQQWSGRDNTRAGGGGRFEVDQITTLSAKLDAM